MLGCVRRLLLTVLSVPDALLGDGPPAVADSDLDLVVPVVAVPMSGLVVPAVAMLEYLD